MKPGALVSVSFTGFLETDKELEGEAVLPGSKAIGSMTLTDRVGSATRIGDPEATGRQLSQSMRGRRLCR